MYIQPGHGLNDFQEFQIRGKSKGGLISRFIFKGIYWRLKIQVKFKGGLNVHKYVKFPQRLSEIRSLKNCGFVLVHKYILHELTPNMHLYLTCTYSYYILFNRLFRSSGMNYYWTWIKSMPFYKAFLCYC